jgi:hypothetical protein
MFVLVKGSGTCGGRERNVKIWIDFRKSPRFSLTSLLSQEREKSSRPVFTMCGEPCLRLLKSPVYHLRMRVECTFFCNLQSRARTHAILMIGLYELLGNPTTYLIEPPGPLAETRCTRNRSEVYSIRWRGVLDTEARSHQYSCNG